MSQGSASDKSYDFLVRAREPGVLAQLIAFIEADASFTLMRRIGPPHEPHTLVVSMAESQAAVLAQHFPGKLIVERDRPLTLYAKELDHT